MLEIWGVVFTVCLSINMEVSMVGVERKMGWVVGDEVKEYLGVSIVGFVGGDLELDGNLLDNLDRALMWFNLYFRRIILIIV